MLLVPNILEKNHSNQELYKFGSTIPLFFFKKTHRLLTLSFLSFFLPVFNLKNLLLKFSCNCDL